MIKHIYHIVSLDALINLNPQAFPAKYIDNCQRSKTPSVEQTV
jgi:hypothetical protein